MSAILPGILEQEWEAIKEKIDILSPFANSIHLDLLDGSYANNTSFLDPAPFATYTKDIDFELHLMVEDPIRYVKPFAEVGFRRFLGHVEMMPDQAAFVALTQQYGEVGLVLDAHTPMNAITVPFEDLDSLLIMSVKAGFSGQSFLSESLHKVSSLAKKHPFLLIEMDGGITQEKLEEGYQAGARRFVATSAIFTQPDPEEAFHHLNEIVARAAEASVLVE